MYNEMTVQLRVDDFKKGLDWYINFLQRKPDFVPSDNFAEWQLVENCWLQLAVGTPSQGSGPIRLSVKSITEERERLKSELNVDYFEINTSENVPVKWATFSDPWGNRLGFFEYK